MGSKLAHTEMEKRFAEINARPPETLTAEEAKHLAEAEAMDDGTAVSLDEFKASLRHTAGSLSSVYHEACTSSLKKPQISKA